MSSFRRTLVSGLVSVALLYGCADEAGPMSAESVTHDPSAVAHAVEDAGVDKSGEIDAAPARAFDAGASAGDAGAGKPNTQPGSDAGLDGASLSDARAAADASNADASSETDAASAPDATVAAPSGLPCAVEALLTRCVGCHGASARNGVALLTYANLTAASKADTTLTIAERAVVRMQLDAKPMPPKGDRMAPDEIAVMEAWIAAGAPETECAAN